MKTEIAQKASVGLEVLREKANYYETIHAAQCGCWKGGHHDNLKRCTCSVGKAFRVLDALLAASLDEETPAP